MQKNINTVLQVCEKVLPLMIKHDMCTLRNDTLHIGDSNLLYRNNFKVCFVMP